MTPLAATEAERLEREVFEKEYGPRDGFAWRNENGTYKIASLQLAWEIWQAARAMQQTAEPVAYSATAADWPDDFAQENGKYENRCNSCGIGFMGNKHRRVCRVCAGPDRAPSTDSAADAWHPIETAPKDGTYILLGNTCGTWIGRYLGVYQSGYRPANPWQSMMLNTEHLAKPGSICPSVWQPLPSAVVRTRGIDAAIAASLPQTKEE